MIMNDFICMILFYFHNDIDIYGYLYVMFKYLKNENILCLEK